MPSVPFPLPRCFAPAGALCLLATIAAVGPVDAARADEADSAAVAVATGSGPLETSISAETLKVEQGADGKEVRRWAPAERLSAGEAVHYTVRVTNPGKEPVTDVVVTKRLPFGVRYQSGSASGPACQVLFSSDGGVTFSVPESPRGSAAKRASRKPAVEFTHVRWVLRKPLAPGATALLRFRATFS